MNRRQCFTSGILAVVIMGSVAASQVWTPTRPAIETMVATGGRESSNPGTHRCREDRRHRDKGK